MADDLFGTLSPGLFGLPSPRQQQMNRMAELLSGYGGPAPGNAMIELMRTQRDPAKMGAPTLQPGSFNWWADQALNFSPVGAGRDVVQAASDIEALPDNPTWGQLLPAAGSAVLAAAGMVPGGGPVLRGFHGGKKFITHFDPAFIRNAQERAIFFSDSFPDAREFGRMAAKGGRPAVTRADLRPRNPGRYDYAKFSEGDPLYTPEVMERILAEAAAAQNDLAIIRGVRNFEHSTPTTTYAVFDPSIIDVRPWPQFGRAAPGGAVSKTPEIKAVTPDQWGFFNASVPGVASEFKSSVDLSKKLAGGLMRDLGMKPHGSSKWSHYGHDRASGASLRVSDHEAHNLGSMGVGNGREMSVVVSPGGGELVLSSPAIRERYGMDAIRLEMPEEEFGKLTSKEGRAWLLDLLQHGGVR